MSMNPKQAGKILTCYTLAEMVDVATKYDLLHDGLIDARGATLKFDHEQLDLSRFMFDGANLAGSRFVNCEGKGTSFRECRLRDVRFSNEAGHSTSLETADFSGATIEGCYFGPRTLKLRNAVFRDAMIRDTKFMLGDLAGADFSGASLSNVDFRNGDLRSVRFVGSHLESVCLEKSTLVDADFTDVRMSRMEDWGEPDFTGAKISDTVRFRFAIVADPVESIARAIETLEFVEDDRKRAGHFLDAVREFAAGVPEAMLIFDEYEDIVDLGLFVQIVREARMSRCFERT